MFRVQLALNVADVDAAVEFYAKLFGAEPAKRRPGYANFAIADETGLGCSTEGCAPLDRPVSVGTETNEADSPSYC